MPNINELSAKDLGQNYLLLGTNGTGKSALYMTLPGKKFIYFFDPHAKKTIASKFPGADLTFEEFLPTKLDVRHTAIAKKGVGRVQSLNPPDAFRRWEDHWMESLDNGFFDQFDCICVDGMSMWQKYALLEIVHNAGRGGHPPELADRNVLAVGLFNFAATFTSLGKTVFLVVHYDYKQDIVTGRMLNLPLIVGQEKTYLNNMFGHVLVAQCQSTQNEIKYAIQTRPDTLNPNSRTSFNNLDMFHDVTIKNFSKPEEYGLGKILKEQGLL